MRQYMISIAVLIIGFATSMTVQAQDAPEAFYIYQNDNHFDGFFYDKVLQMNYSKFDTLGIEHDDYVSQEIVTADSTYRIMLSAIDSIGFVQPEIIYNPKLRNLDDEGMTGYLVSRDGLTLTFSSDMPSDKTPHVDDVLVCYDFNRFEGGFGGKVTAVDSSGGNLVVTCGPLTDFSDIFTQFITVEEYSDDGQGNLTRKRTAGLKSPRKVDGSFDGNIFNFSANPHIPWTYGSFTASLDLNLSLQADVRASWNIPVFGRKKFSIELNETFGIGAGLTFDGQLSDLKTIDLDKLAPIYLPAAVPIFQLKLIPKPFLRSQVHATFNMSTPTWKKKLSQCINFDDWKFSGSMSMGATEKDGDDVNLSGSINGFVQGGALFPFAIRTNEFFASVLDAEVGLNIFIGPKLSGELSTNVGDVAKSAISDGVDLKTSPLLYNLLKDVKINFTPLSVDYEMSSKVKAFVGSTDKMTLLDGSAAFGSRDLYLLPAFDDIDADESNLDVKVTIDHDPERFYMFGNVGAALFRGDGVFLGNYFTNFLSRPVNRGGVVGGGNEGGVSEGGNSGKQTNSTTVSFTLDQGGPYVLRPAISLGGYEFPANLEHKFESPAPYFYFRDIKPGAVDTLSYEPQIHTINVETNGEVAFDESDESAMKLTQAGNKVYLLDVPYRGGVYKVPFSKTFKHIYKGEDGEPVTRDHSYSGLQLPSYVYTGIEYLSMSFPVNESEYGYGPILDLEGLQIISAEGDSIAGVTVVASKSYHNYGYSTEQGYYEKEAKEELQVEIKIAPKGFIYGYYGWGEETQGYPYIESMTFRKESKHVTHQIIYKYDEEGHYIGEEDEFVDTTYDDCSFTINNLCYDASYISDGVDTFSVIRDESVNKAFSVTSFSARRGSEKEGINNYTLNPDGECWAQVQLRWKQSPPLNE